MSFYSKAKMSLFFVILITFILFCSIFFLSLRQMLPSLQALIFAFIVALGGELGILFLFYLMMKKFEKTEKSLIYQSQYDPVTDLPNRIKCFEDLHSSLKNNPEAIIPMAIVTIGIVRFPQINHALGHRIGDRLLHHVARKLEENLSNAKILCRFASNVFIAVFENVTPYNYKVLARQILELFEYPFSVYTVTIDLDVLIGFSFFPSDGLDPDSLIQKADLALYSARNSAERFSAYSPEIDPHHYNKLSLMSELKEGLLQNEFELFFQPKVDFKTGKITHVEALVRWQHPIKGFIEPNQFIPFAEETGHIKKLTLWVIEKAILQCSLWQKQGIPLSIAINLSVKDLLNFELPTHVASCLKEHQVEPHWITFEITESAFMQDPHNAMKAILKLKELKVQLSIDDFGTGFSSLKYLKTLPIDEIKIDKIFTEDIIRSERSAEIVRSTILLGHSINMKVVAEGLSDDATYDKLKEMGCDLGQGYLFAKPLSLKDLSEWLKNSPWGLS